MVKSYPINLFRYIYCFGVWTIWAINSLRLLWSVRMINGCPSKYCLHFLIVVVMVSSSRKQVNACKSLGQNCLLKKAMGWPFCDKTALIPTPEASISKVKGKEKSRSRKIDVVLTTSLNFWKAIYAFEGHSKWSFIKMWVRGAAIVAYPLINRTPWDPGTL